MTKPATARDEATTQPDSTFGLVRLRRLAAEVVAPTTLLTALFFFFGWSHAYWFFDYFGVNSTVLGLTTQDYLMRAVDGLFVPLTVVAVVGLLAVWVPVALPDQRLARFRGRIERAVTPVATATGLLLVANGLSRILWITPLNESLAVAPLCLGAGVGLLMYAVRRRRRARRGAHPASEPVWHAFAEWSAAFVLVALSLFWAANDYSAAVGTTRAEEFVRSMPSHPRVILYSARSLSVDSPSVHEAECQDAEAAYRFRYDGLVLMLQSDDQYVLLPEDWTPTRGRALILPRGDSLRLEFVSTSSRETVLPASC